MTVFTFVEVLIYICLCIWCSILIKGLFFCCCCELIADYEIFGSSISVKNAEYETAAIDSWAGTEFGRCSTLEH